LKLSKTRFQLRFLLFKLIQLLANDALWHGFIKQRFEQLVRIFFYLLQLGFS